MSSYLIYYRVRPTTKKQMPNIENQIDTIQKNINANASNDTAYFTTLDLKYVKSIKFIPKNISSL